MVHVVVTHTDSPEDLAVILATGPDAVQISADLTVPPNAGVKVIRVIGPGMPLRNDCDALIVDIVIGAVLGAVIYIVFLKLLTLSLPAGPLEALLG